MNDILLSILICHIPGRADKLERLMTILRPQLPADGSVEVIIKEERPKAQGGPVIGVNRNAALEDAAGDYVCFIDDDDVVTQGYVDEILEALETQPDVVGLKGHYIVAGKQPELFVHSIENKEWITTDGVHLRPPNHLNPVRRELALQTRFPAKNHGEDHDYSMGLLPLLKREVMIDKVIYHYLKD